MKRKNSFFTYLKAWVMPNSILFLLLIVAAGFLVFIAFVPNNQTLPEETGKLRSFNEGWIRVSNRQAIILPCQLESAANEEIVISKQIPLQYNDGNAFYIALISSWQSVQVFIEDTPVYGYYLEESRFYEVAPPPYYNLVRITPDMLGKTISIVYNSPMDEYSGILNEINTGSKFDLITSYVGTGARSFLLCFAIFIVGLITVVLCIFMKKKLGTSDHLVYLGIFSILVSVWSGCETRIIQFLMHDSQLNIFITLFCVMILPIPLLLFFQHNFAGRIKKIYQGLSYLFIIHFIVRLILQVTSIFGIYRLFGYYTILCAVILLWIAASSIYLYYKQKKKQTFLSIIAVFTLFIFTGIDIIRFLVGNIILTNSEDAFIFFRMGILFFILILAYSILEEILTYYQESIKAAAYKELAYTDSLSQLNNRTYLLELYPDIFREAISKEDPLAMIMIDIDNFKKYNDNYGHISGDKVIFEISKVIRKNVVHPLDAAIRYGGEEFLIVMPETTEKGAALLSEQIACDIKQLNLTHAYSESASVITVSQGIYCGIPKRGETLECYMQKADEALYQAKEAGKNQVRILN